MRRLWRWRGTRCLTAAAAAIAIAGPACGAIVREHRVGIEVRGDGTVLESIAWTVQLQSAHDLERWSPFPILLGDHHKLLRLDGSVQPPQGPAVAVKRSHRDRTGVVGEGILHESTEAELVDFGHPPEGSVLTLSYAVEEHPYYPSGAVELAGADPVEHLQVEVRAPALRTKLTGGGDGVQFRSSEGSAVVSGTLPARAELERLPTDAAPVLRYAWGDATGWPAVGFWYASLLAQVPRGGADIAALAQRLTAGAADRPQAVLRLVNFVRAEIRYVAVEVGVGGYRPSAPGVVLARRWGDCKDKAFLLVDLLAAIGVESRIALVRADEEGQIDPAFPSPDQFNHAIAAVAASAVTTLPEAPVAGGWLFVDATQRRGGLDWVHPAVAGQRALVVTPTGGELVEIPVHPASEAERLTVELATASNGTASGKARIDLHGLAAAALDREMDARDDAQVVASADQMLHRQLPGAALEAIEVSTAKQGAPSARIAAAIHLPAFVTGAGNERAVLLPGRSATPGSSLLETRREPVVLTPGVTASEWQIELPWQGCQLAAAGAAAENAIGSFKQEAILTGSTLVVRRRIELRSRQATAAQFADLRSLALAEHHALQRRLRLTCPGSY